MGKIKYKRARELNIQIGDLQPGAKNKITDVPGVTVGHHTLSNGNIQTGVTAILPHQGNIFKEKVIASSHVFNGFGKTAGTIQINELGTVETPIILTNTFAAGTCSAGLIKYMLKDNLEPGRTTGTINPVVCECNDMILNDIREAAVEEHHVTRAIEAAGPDFEEGAHGAGRGMKCFGLKGGIGSASRFIHAGDRAYTLGVLVLSNFGNLQDFVLDGKKAGKRISEIRDTNGTEEKDQGSIIMILATDLPVTDRQLNRIIRRCGNGLSRTGSNMGHGSGDLVIGFSTATRIPHKPEAELLSMEFVHEEELDQPFKAAAEATEEAIINSMLMAETTTGRDGNQLISLSEYAEKLI
ncbi:P1 family peptidase [Evansella clarkii]|uniref:DmpA family aminopeptidase n=1 Tax=Evansella clarkii TaxID=79879 RepID=UPI000B446254|nr:P1 family peptidase [Evansella clarkii]